MAADTYLFHHWIEGERRIRLRALERSILYHPLRRDAEEEIARRFMLRHYEWAKLLSGKTLRIMNARCVHGAAFRGRLAVDLVLPGDPARDVCFMLLGMILDTPRYLAGRKDVILVGQATSIFMNA